MILDTSGSMSHMQQTVVDSHNTFLAEQQQSDTPMRFSRVWFNHHVWGEPTNGGPLCKAEPLTLNAFEPRGRTALLDAIGLTINARADEHDAVVVVITDGLENSSTSYERQHIATMIETCERERGWSFIFLAAGLDVMHQATQLGFDKKRAFNMGRTQRAHKQGMDLLSIKMGLMRKHNDRMHLEFTDDERRQADDQDPSTEH
jgi:hypothetical protein